MSFNSVGLAGFQRLCSTNDLEEKKGKRFIIDYTDIAVFLIEKKVYAVGNICPHQHTALIYDGFLEDGFVVCPAHGWKFDLTTGKTSEGGKGLDVYESKLVGDQVYIKIQDKKSNW